VQRQVVMRVLMVEGGSGGPTAARGNEAVTKRDETHARKEKNVPGGLEVCEASPGHVEHALIHGNQSVLSGTVRQVAIPRQSLHEVADQRSEVSQDAKLPSLRCTKKERQCNKSQDRQSHWLLRSDKEHSRGRPKILRVAALSARATQT